MGFIRHVKEEFQVIQERDPSIKSPWEVLLYPSFRVMMTYRKAHKLYEKGHYLNGDGSEITIDGRKIVSGLTQEQFSEGICSSNSLARIERGELGVSASTFQALLSRVGITSELMPCFASREDFECYYLLKKINWRLEHYQLKSVADELQAIKDMNWANNK